MLPFQSDYKRLYLKGVGKLQFLKYRGQVLQVATNLVLILWLVDDPLHSHDAWPQAAEGVEIGHSCPHLFDMCESFEVFGEDGVDPVEDVVLAGIEFLRVFHCQYCIYSNLSGIQ